MVRLARRSVSHCCGASISFRLNARLMMMVAHLQEARAAESLPSGDHEKADLTIEGEALLRYFAVDLLQPIFASRYSQSNQLSSSGASRSEP